MSNVDANLIQKWCCKICKTDGQIVSDPSKAFCKKCGANLLSDGYPSVNEPTVKPINTQDPPDFPEHQEPPVPPQPPVTPKPNRKEKRQNKKIEKEIAKEHKKEEKRRKKANRKECGRNKSKKRFKIFFKVLLAVICLILIALGAEYYIDNFYDPYEPTTQENLFSTTASTTSMTTSATTNINMLSPVIPDFLNFANGYASQDSYEYTEETGLKHIYYLVNEDAVMTVFDEYVELLCTEYAYKLINEDEYYDWYGFEFVGTGVVGKFYNEFPSGAKYHNNSVSLQFHDYTNGNYELELTISELIDIVKTDKRTTYSEENTAVFPDFEDFAGGYATLIDTEERSYVKILNYELDVEYDYATTSFMNEYCNLILEDYHFDEIYVGKKTKWRAFKYTGDKAVTDFYSTFGSGDEKYDDINFDIYVYTEDEKVMVEICHGIGLKSTSTKQRTSYYNLGNITN